jgi:predicted RNA-binding protein with PUA-like domain
MKKHYWLAKSDFDDYKISDLKREKQTQWTGVRNYQARNYLMEMAKGDEVVFYHSNGDPAGAAGTAKVVSNALPDPTQFEKKSDYFDPKATEDKPRWFAPNFSFQKEFSAVISLSELSGMKELAGSLLLKRGNRLSVFPISQSEFEAIESAASARKK